MIHRIKQFASSARSIRAGVIGVGAVGTGVAMQVAQTPRLKVVLMADTSEEALARAVRVVGLTGVRVDDLVMLSAVEIPDTERRRLRQRQAAL